MQHLLFTRFAQWFARLHAVPRAVFRRMARPASLLWLALLGAAIMAACAARAVEPTAMFNVPIPPDTEEHPIAIEFLPKTSLGYVDWVKALQGGTITPFGSINEGEVEMTPIDFDVVFRVKGDIPDVVYPHLPHTQWLDCRNCHPDIFKMKAGSNPITMAKIVEGEYCGRCHGKVAFPLYDCARCHSKPK